MLVKLYEDNPNPRDINEVVKILKGGGIIIYPTDTLYAFGCDITNAKAVERICAIKNINPDKMPLSLKIIRKTYLYTKILLKIKN